MLQFSQASKFYKLCINFEHDVLVNNFKLLQKVVIKKFLAAYKKTFVKFLITTHF